MSAGLRAVVAASLLAAPLEAQQPAPTGGTAATPAFEVASIRPNRTVGVPNASRPHPVDATRSPRTR